MQDTLDSNSERRTFDCRDIMPLQSESFWLLKQGIVKTCTWTEEGAAITLGYWGSGDVVGQPLSLVEPYQVECLTAVTAFSIPLNRCCSLIEPIRLYVQQTEELLYIVRSERVYQRLHRILVWLAQKFGQEVEAGKLIKLRLTHQDLAEAIGTTRVTVTKLINQLEQEGIISRPQRNSIILRSPELYFS